MSRRQVNAGFGLAVPVRACVLLALLVQGSSSQAPGKFFQQAGARTQQYEERYGEYWLPHLNRSSRGILSAMDLAQGRTRAVVLGAGKCREIPLEALAKEFEEVVLVDLDRDSLHEATDRLSPGVRSRIRIQVSDVTSFGQTLMERIRMAVQAGHSVKETFQRLESVYARASQMDSRVQLPAGDLVVSSLLLSELHWYPLRYTDQLLQEKFGVSLSHWNGSVHARSRLERLARADHVALLEELSRPGGVIYFADTIAGGPLQEDVEADQRARIFLKLSRGVAAKNIFAQLARRQPAREAFAAALGKTSSGLPPRHRDVPSGGLLERLVSSPDSVSPQDAARAAEAVVELACGGHVAVAAEIAVLEQLMDLWEGSAPDTLEPQLAVSDLAAEWRQNGLRTVGEPEDWWWLASPCSIARSWGAFKVRSWILRRAVPDKGRTR